MIYLGYRKRLSKDLPRWREQGWVSAEGAAAILASLEGQRTTFGLAAIIGILGALLLGAGVVAFVSANWELMPRIFRFALLVMALAAAYGAAAALAAKELRMFSEAALLLAGIVFAAAIALVGQTYHLAGEFTDAFLLWEIGILVAALATGSATLTGLALVGSGYWTWLNVIDLVNVPHWGGLLAILIGGLIALRLQSHYVRLVAVVTLSFWIALNLIGLSIRLDWSPIETLAIATSAALIFWASGSLLTTFSIKKGLVELGYAMLWPGIASILLAVGVLQTAPDWQSSSGANQWLILAGAGVITATLLSAIAWRRGGMTIIDFGGAAAIGVAAIGYALFLPSDPLTYRLIGAVIVFGAALWAINLGQSGPQRVGKKTGLAAFGIEVIYLYIVTFGSLIDTALAFLGGGVVFIALAYGLFRIDRRLAGNATTITETRP